MTILRDLVSELALQGRSSYTWGGVVVTLWVGWPVVGVVLFGVLELFDVHVQAGLQSILGACVISLVLIAIARQFAQRQVLIWLKGHPEHEIAELRAQFLSPGDCAGVVVKQVGAVAIFLLVLSVVPDGCFPQE